MGSRKQSVVLGHFLVVFGGFLVVLGGFLVALAGFIMVLRQNLEPVPFRDRKGSFVYSRGDMTHGIS